MVASCAHPNDPAARTGVSSGNLLAAPLRGLDKRQDPGFAAGVSAVAAGSQA